MEPSLFSLSLYFKNFCSPYCVLQRCSQSSKLVQMKGSPPGLGCGTLHQTLAPGSALGMQWEEVPCAVGEQWGSSVGRMKFPLWKLLCALVLVKSAIKFSVLKRFFNDVLNSELSKFQSCAFGRKLIRTVGVFSYTVKILQAVFYRITQKLCIP